MGGILYKGTILGVVNMVENGCKICAAGNRGYRRTQDYTVGRCSPVEIAAEFDMTPEEVMEHMNEHEIRRVVVNGKEMVDSPDFYLNELASIFNKLRDYSDLIIMSEDKPDKNTIEMITKLSAETRRTLESMATLQGRLTRGNELNVKNMEVRVLSLTEVIMKEACPECQRRILKVIDATPLLSTPKTI